MTSTIYCLRYDVAKCISAPNPEVIFPHPPQYGEAKYTSAPYPEVIFPYPPDMY